MKVPTGTTQRDGEIAVRNGAPERSSSGVVAERVLAPLGRGPVDRLLNGEVGHERAWPGSVPVPFAGLGPHGVPGADLLDRPATPLDQAGALGDVQHLPTRMRVPGRVRAGGEVDAEYGDR